MSVNLSKYRESLLAAWKDVLDEKTSTNWALFGYEGLSNDLKFISKGDGGIEELIDDLNSGKVMYGFLKVDMPSGAISKFVLINWQGEGAPNVRKGSCANHVRDVTNLFMGSHLTMHARTEDDLDPQLILDKLATAGSAFNFKSPRSEQTPKGPVGTVYQKVNPGKEINSEERDQFWLKEEQEEKKRVAAEKLRKEQEKRKAEEDLRKRDELEASRRAKAEQERSMKKSSPTDLSPTAGLTASEALRKQRSAEAKELIGHSTSAARALFEQNLAQGQMMSKKSGYNNVPEKPIRSSVVAQRINSLTQSQSQPAKPTLQQPEEPEPAKTSPIRNIDKIKMSLESPSQIQYEPIFDPLSVGDLSPSTETEPSSFSSVITSSYSERSQIEQDSDIIKAEPAYRDIKIPPADPDTSPTKEPVVSLVQSEPIIKQNILENDMFDASYSSSSNDNDDDDSDNKFSTIKRSPYSKTSPAEGTAERGELSRQNTVIENVNFKKEHTNGTNGTATLDDISPEGLEDDGIYQDLDDDPGLAARALYDYQAADDSEITFDPGDIITHIDQIDEGWWQGLGPQGTFGLFPANYVELLPCKPRQ